jgi:beta-glucanase (GH16 family)
MKKARPSVVFLGLCLLVIGIGVLRLALEKDAALRSAALLQNGQLSIKNADGSLQVWKPLLSTEKIDRVENYVTIHNDSSDTVSGLSQTIAVKPEWSRILVRGDIKVDAADTLAAAGVYMYWLGPRGKQLTPIEPQTESNTSDWTSVNSLLDIPKGAISLVVSIQLGNAAGDIDFRNFRVNGWILTFDDEFNATAFNPSHWTKVEGIHYHNADEKQWFNPRYVTVKGGSLIIHTDAIPHKDYRGSFNYQSGDIISKGKFQQLYGFFEFRAKVPMTMGIWPADVLLPWNDSWPPEIDVQELCAKDMGRVYETNHYLDDSGVHQCSGPIFPAGSLDRKEWHTYAVAWEPGSVSWYIDGKYTGEVHEPIVKVSNVPMYITINTATGQWCGDPAEGSWPQDFITDYVRVYQRNDIPLPVYPKEFQEITLPQKTALLSAIGPEPSTGATAKWTLQEGPGKATIKTPNSLHTKAIFSAPGMYCFRITVSKNSTCDSDEQLVFVNRPL